MTRHDGHNLTTVSDLDSDGSPADMQTTVPTYDNRLLFCTRPSCLGRFATETAHMQLWVRIGGFRNICCSHCKVQSRTGRWLCECHELWHRCPQHSVDPLVHATTRKRPSAKHALPIATSLLSTDRPEPEVKRPRKVTTCTVSKRKSVVLSEHPQGAYLLDHGKQPKLAAKFPHRSVQFRHSLTASEAVSCTDDNDSDIVMASSSHLDSAIQGLESGEADVSPLSHLPPAVQGCGTVLASQAVSASVRLGAGALPVPIRPRGRFRRDLAKKSESQSDHPSGTVPPRLSGCGSVRTEGDTN